MGKLGRKKEVIKACSHYSAFGNWIAKYCEEYNLAKVDLNNQLGASYSVVDCWLYGSNVPRVLALIELCQLFSRLSNRSPLILLAEAMSTFPEMTNAVNYWNQRNEINTIDRVQLKILAERL